MKLPPDSVISDAKITEYLLVRQSRGDKSAFLERGGFTRANPGSLVAEIRSLLIREDCTLVDENVFGKYYEIAGELRGTNGVMLKVRTIWMTEHLSRVTKFITLIPVEILSV